MATTWIITITGCDPATGNLTLSPAGVITVNPGDIIQWVIAPTSGVTAIIAIVEKPGPNHDVFDPNPAQLANSSTWQGTINPSFTSETEEAYSIQWANATAYWLNHNPPVYTFDPIIAVKPSGK